MRVISYSLLCCVQICGTCFINSIRLFPASLCIRALPCLRKSSVSADMIGFGVWAPGLLKQIFQRMQNSMGVKYILDRVENGSSEEVFPPGSFEQIYNVDGWKIYLNKDALPRTYFSHSEMFFTGVDEWDAFGTSVSYVPAHGRCEQMSAEIASYEATDVVIQTDASCGGVLVLSDMYYPGWRVTVDAVEKNLLRVNWAFRGVYVPEGVHTVTFTYVPVSVTAGIIGTVVSSIIMGGVALYEKKHRFVGTFRHNNSGRIFTAVSAGRYSQRALSGRDG